MTQPYVTIIIPTYNDWSRLQECLQLLKVQTISKENFEIIIANNNPSDKAPVDFTLPENARVIDVFKKGSYAARNEAIKLSRGDILGFTDSDCLPEKKWIENAISFFSSHPEISRLAGKIDLFYKGSKLNSAELFEKLYAFKQDLNVLNLRSSVTGNMFSFKKVFESVGYFREDLLSGGDHEWSERADAAGFKIAFVENVVLSHPARNSISQLTKKVKRVAGGKTMQRTPKKLRTLAGLVKIIKPPNKAFFNALKNYGSDFTFSEKCRVFFLKYYLDAVERLESALITFGKNPTRE